MKSIILGYPRIGEKRELKKAIETYWKGKTSEEELSNISKNIREKNWLEQNKLGADLISSNDFSLYDQMLDMCITLGCIPQRFSNLTGLEQYFAMSRGIQKENVDVIAMEMTKWFDTNYHFLVPEFSKDQSFSLNAEKIINEHKEAFALGINTKPVIIGPVTFLLLGKEKESGFNSLELLDKILPIYGQLIKTIDALGAEYIQIDEPILATDLDMKGQEAVKRSYEYFGNLNTKVKLILANYFDCYGENLDLTLKLPVDVIHLDLVRCRKQLEDILTHPSLNRDKILSLGVVDGRNIWKNNFKTSFQVIEQVKEKLPPENIWIGTSCSLLHSPLNLDFETELNPEIKQWLAFAKQKVDEVVTLKTLVIDKNNTAAIEKLRTNTVAIESRKTSNLIHNEIVKERVNAITEEEARRKNVFSIRKEKQHKALNLPLFPTTTIGSFPQTKEVRSWRAKFKNGSLDKNEYNKLLKEETEKAIRIQEDIGIDVLVHGEFERNDMVEYFGEQLDGFVFTQNGWVQSYGTRCVKPPIIYGDVSRPKPITVEWSAYAQSLSNNWMKGMLTGPVTILQWSFVRNDQPRSETCTQIALAIRDEVSDLEKAGIKIIQIDEPAFREGLPLRKENWNTYLNWAVKAFRISSSSVQDETQIHTHMCYSEFNDIIHSISNLDADVITIETSRSQMELLDAFVEFKYPNEIGPGVYDIHSPRVPSTEEMKQLLEKAQAVIPTDQLWVNPDCGLKTRNWPETKVALENLVKSAKHMRIKALQEV
ncbi:5-methyltetrahydropteroyltriglutamate--homocysteine S-methyltransferase [Hyunsoonleella pacifica]|uniref:5-methyltetrahydropteroyltriglutamate--homocysteine methyltransferase n=1 Tax=Hyunsoonleella pacifica TaxID=1080224 RepID=A0A4Q9FN43_9FLAO|nr:5-methyltetrahydropteroyltriglutamate--homocysteine S-methyltransferase [Hyunsoonleella pacifica]TBN15364.1 5-methyltetrahydropteroyltriglutamate--homocysteine S-methyltransferase [Hyunsoonleella pacifica]GGD23437.1 5-methyltetrahydropteroyltriglutamate--homocysteine methyltransferase [Hyunsoonleella pacifica]